MDGHGLWGDAEERQALSADGELGEPGDIAGTFGSLSCCPSRCAAC